MNQPTFYDQFHKKNNFYWKIIGDRNFTYFYTLQFLLEPCMKPVARPKVLDVGCGVGTLSLYMAKKGANVLGVDISPRAIAIAEHAREVNHLRNAVFKSGELVTGQSTFDSAICSEIIEHIPDDSRFLQVVYSHLKPGGVLYLSTPSSENWLYKRGFYQQFDREVGHLRRYSVQSISQLLKTNGFQIFKVRQVEGPLRNLLFTTQLGFLIKLIRGPLVPIFHWFDQLSALIFGAHNILILAKKV